MDKVIGTIAEEFIDRLKNDYKNIVLLYKPDDKCNLLELTKKSLYNSETISLQILPFYLRKRKELIKCVLKNAVNKVDGLDDKVVEINNFISNQLHIFSINPSFITMYVSYYIDNNNNSEVQTNIFSKVFELNMVKSLQRYVDNDSIEEYLTVLENIAYKMHFTKTYPMSIAEIQNIINDYNTKFMMNIDSTKFRRNVIKAKILEEIENDNLKFTDNLYLAYFVACSLNKKASNFDITKEELLSVCDNLCFNINGDILLFLSYITKNVKILQFIFNKAKSVTSEWEELDLQNNNINFLTMSSEQVMPLPSKEDIELHEKNLEEQEKRITKNLEIKTKSIYDDYDENKANSKGYKLDQSIKLLELISKILPNFNHLIEKDDKLKLANGIYEIPNKICNEVLLDVDANFNFMINDLMQYCEEKNIDIDKNKIIDAIQLQSQIFILNLFDMTARLSTNSKTISILNTIPPKNINYKILNVMMYENLGNFDLFAQKADKVYDDNKDFLIRSMIKRIIRKHFLCNKGLKQIGYVQKIATKYFGNNRKFL